MQILPEKSLQGKLLLATELADYLVSKGIPFREAHRVVGKIVHHCEQNELGLDNLDVTEFQQFHPSFSDDIQVWLDPKQAAERRTSRGGTAWKEVTRQIIQLRKTLAV
jgi:argininosuccinate lyase